ncbi:MAG: hypothetical protein FJ087_08955 [Deltaproteobacteria bacterium]|nr:hypothetical protein [Deltaproteobacteria bacterium]
MRRAWIVAVAVVLATAWVACDDDEDGNAGFPPNCPLGVCAAGPDHAPDPMLPGPYPVGVRTVVLVDPAHRNADGSPRTLKTEIWYPTTDDQRGKPKYAYDPKEDATEAARRKIGTIELGKGYVDAVKDAPVRRGERFPLVLFSHGAFGIRFQSIFVTVPLASHGYVVVSPDHQGNTLYDILVTGYDQSRVFQSVLDRPIDLLFLLDEMGRWDADPANEFHQTIEADNVGVVGHSLGGYACFGVAWHMQPDGNMGPDPRVKALVPHAPAGYLMGALGVYAPDWHLPTTIMGGKLDRTLPYEASFEQPYNDLGRPKYFLGIARGGHYTFSDMCLMDLKRIASQMDFEDAEAALEDGCGEENWDYREAQKPIILYTVATLNTYLRHSPGTAKYLTAEAGSRFGSEITFLAAP